MKIGFYNFRKFKKLDPLEINGITFLVGRNNAGKSTLAKAIILTLNFFKSNQIEKFLFSGEKADTINIPTFGRAMNVNSDDKTYIQFTIALGNNDRRYTANITLKGDLDKNFGYVNSINISDETRKLSFAFEVFNKSLLITKRHDDHKDHVTAETIENLQSEIDKLEATKGDHSKASKEYILAVEKIEKLNSKLNFLNNQDNQLRSFKSFQFQLEEFINVNQSLFEIVSEVLEKKNNEFNRLKFQSSQNSDETIKRNDYDKSKSDDLKYQWNITELQSFSEFGTRNIEDSIREFQKIIDTTNIYSIGLNVIRQGALYSIRDKNNGLAQAIDEFYQLNIKPGDQEYQYIQKWMNEFDIGNDFEILHHAGEAYELNILQPKGKIPLSDKGMGSAQAMMLLVRTGSIIRRKTIKDEDIEQYIVVIEEPELNLHPALQSKLADLFLECHEKYGIKFLIETHSEYILRRSQVLVAKNEFEKAPNENPFIVHYFPGDLQNAPYTMKYNEDGSFKNNFGEGFFDAAAGSTLELLKIKRQNSS